MINMIAAPPSHGALQPAFRLFAVTGMSKCPGVHGSVVELAARSQREAIRFVRERLPRDATAGADLIARPLD